MANQDMSELNKFIELMAKSGLPDERVSFWSDKIESGEISDQDEADFLKELHDHADNLDEAIALTTIEREESAKSVDTKKEEALPYLRDLNSKDEEYYATQEADYKAKIGKAEAECMKKLEGSRDSSEEQEADDIRRELGLG